MQSEYLRYQALIREEGLRLPREYAFAR